MYSIGLYIGEIGLDFYDLNMSYCHTVIPHAFDCHRFISWRQYIRLKVRWNNLREWHPIRSFQISTLAAFLELNTSWNQSIWPEMTCGAGFNFKWSTYVRKKTMVLCKRPPELWLCLDSADFEMILLMVQKSQTSPPWDGAKTVVNHGINR